MRHILIIGIGAGNPEHMTVEAIAALNRVDVFFIPDKGAEKAALRDLREAICNRFITERDYRSVVVPIPQRAAAGQDYRGAVDDWHGRIAAAYRELFEAELAEGEIGALLVWGDPALYDSTIRVMELVAAAGLAIDWQVYPGISSVQVLAARHRLPLNAIGGAILVTTGRRLAEGFPADQDSVVVMLDGEQAFDKIAASGLDIFWGAYLGTPDEILISGPLAEVAARIVRVRAEARSRHGWIMDTYLLRRSAAA